MDLDELVEALSSIARRNAGTCRYSVSLSHDEKDARRASKTQGAFCHVFLVSLVFFDAFIDLRQMLLAYALSPTSLSILSPSSQQHPSAFARLCAEISLSSTKTSSPQHIPYLSAILHETHRLHPQNPLLLWQVQKDTYLPHSSDPDHPLLVLEGAYVACLVGSLNSRRELFGLEAGMFKPERWIDGSCRPDRGYCLESVDVGMKMVGHMVARMVTRWDIENTGEEGAMMLRPTEG